jgi:hypothetical protein
MFDCRTLGQQTVYLWVTDLLTGKQAFCRTFIEIQDNNKACGQTIQNGTISGLVSNKQDNNSMNNVEVSLIDLKTTGNPVISSITTKSDGEFAFGNMALNNGHYSILPTKNSDPLNGVTTADIVKIQRHILGLEPLTSAYKFIAADVNNDYNITSKDIAELRKLILGVHDKFLSNQSWIFIDAAYSFTAKDVDVLKENYPKDYVINPFAQSMLGLDFKGIKVGDITGNASASLHTTTTRGDLTDVNFITNELKFNSNEELIVPLFVEQAVSLAGYQFTIQFDPKSLEFIGISSAACNMTNENIGIQNMENGQVTLSWNSNKNFELNSSDKLFALKFKALSHGYLSKVLQFNSSITMAQAFTAEAIDMDVKLGFRNNNGVVENYDGIILYQNQPNPFSELTVIGFELPKASSASITVYDINSKVIYKDEINAAKGYNSFELNTSQLGATGVLFYQLDAAGYTATKRMVVIK